MNTTDKSNKDNRIAHKNLAIRLNNFSYLHSDVNGKDDNCLYIGREKLIDKLVGVLDKTAGGRGSYLVSGYRGVGKSSFVDKVLSRYEEHEKNRVICVKINLGGKKLLTSKNIYYSIVNILRQELNDDRSKINKFLLHTRLIKHPSSPGILNELDELELRMGYEVTDSESMTGGVKGASIDVKRSLKSMPLSAREAEYKLRKIINSLNCKKMNIVFVFDELDKLSEREIDESDQDNKTHKINSLLSEVKNFITTTHAIFIFIAGRETLDSYYSERDSANSLYESLFDQVFELPSLLTAGIQSGQDVSPITYNVEKYVCRRLGRKYKGNPYESLNEFYKDFYEREIRNGKNAEEVDKNIKLAVLTLRNLINYLCFHSWGNPKRLSSMFESLICQFPSEEGAGEHCMKININSYEKKSLWLILSFNQQRSMAFCNGLFTLFQHQLSREVSTIGDKLTVSSLAALQFILKFHQYAFTRESLHRMSEALNNNKSPELNIIVDDLLSHVFKPYIRRVRNGAYRYRFNSEFEQGIRYISSISEFESASFNFSLDAMSRVKQYFKDDFSNDSACDIVRAKSAVTLGDMNAIEQSFNDASKYYSAAIHFLLHELDKEIGKDVKDIDVEVSYLEVLIKYGDMEEHRQNYNKAAVYYAQANKYLREKYETCKSGGCSPAALADSKWEIYKLAYWAGLFLSLKRSPIKEIETYLDDNLKDIIYSKSGINCDSKVDDTRYTLRLANYYFFNGSENIQVAAKYYYLSYKHSLKNWPTNERCGYISGSAYSGLAESTLIYKSFKLFNNLRESSVSATVSLPREVSMILRFKIYPPNEGCSPSKYSSVESFEVLKKAAEIFYNVNLYSGSIISYFKLISYRLTMLDVFNCHDELYDITEEEIDKYFKEINHYAERAIECINLARQLDSSQSIKTLEVRDYASFCKSGSDDYLLTQLFEYFKTNGDGYPLKEGAFWQHSLWGQKLASLLYWGEFIKSKIIKDYRSKVLPYENNEKYFEPSKIPSLSIRSSILMRWVYSRSLIKERLYSKGGSKGFKIKNFPAYSNLNYGVESVGNEWKCAYNVLRNLYFILLDISLISRKNLDLVYPTMTHIYYIQWNLLRDIICAALSDDELVNKYGFKSLRSVSMFVQKQFRELDEKLGGSERIAPSHFDYEYVYTNLKMNLRDVVMINDETGRIRTSILQQKYFFHDDHSDQGFRMDWTLSHLFAPSAYCLSEKLEKKHELLVRAIKSARLISFIKSLMRFQLPFKITQVADKFGAENYIDQLLCRQKRVAKDDRRKAGDDRRKAGGDRRKAKVDRRGVSV